MPPNVTYTATCKADVQYAEGSKPFKNYEHTYTLPNKASITTDRSIDLAALQSQFANVCKTNNAKSGFDKIVRFFASDIVTIVNP